jgi:O-antigen ligase
LTLNWRSSLDFFHHLDGKTLLYFVGLFLCIAAMFMTASRAGAALSFLGLAIAYARTFQKTLSRRGGAAMTLACIALIGLVAMQVMGTGILSRLEMEGLTEGGRIQTYLYTLRMVEDHPWFGVGLGNFAWSYPAYRGDEISMWGVWTRTHSTPLELAAELGIPLAVVICVNWLIILTLLGHGIWRRERPPSTTLAAFCVSLIAILHSMFDFSLQDPGFSILVFALAGAGMAQSLRPSLRMQQ